MQLCTFQSALVRSFVVPRMTRWATKTRHARVMPEPASQPVGLGEGPLDAMLPVGNDSEAIGEKANRSLCTGSRRAREALGSVSPSARRASSCAERPNLHSGAFEVAHCGALVGQEVTHLGHRTWCMFLGLNVGDVANVTEDALVDEEEARRLAK